MTRGYEDDVDDDKLCKCGHPLYMHDDGVDACVMCTTCKKFEAQDEAR